MNSGIITATVVEPTNDTTSIDGSFSHIAQEHCFGVIALLAYITPMIIAGLVGASTEELWVRIPMTFGSIACIVLAIILSFRMHSAVTAVLVTICLLIPWVQVIAYLIVMSEASKTIKARGFRLGLLGNAKPPKNSPVTT